MLIGEYQAPVGDKNRLALPKKLREEFGEQLILARGYEGAVLLLDLARWQHLLDEINKRPLLSMSVRDTKRFLLGGAHEVTLDSQGRFVIPESLRLFAAIEDEATFIGVGEWAEMWASSKWQQKLADLATNASDIADRLLT